MRAPMVSIDVPEPRQRRHHRVVEDMAKAIKLHREGQLERAAAIYQSILDRYPNFADALHLLGAVALQQNDAVGAVELIGRAVELKPDQPAFHCHLARAQLTLGRHEDAVVSYRACLRLQPDNIEAVNDLGMTLHALGKHRDAVGCFQAALRLLPNAGEIHSNLANAYLELGNIEQAVLNLRQAAHLLPGSSELQLNLGNAYREVGRMEEAKVCYREALRLEPRTPGALAHLATILRDKFPEEDLAALERLGRDTSLPDVKRIAAHFGLAQAFDARGEYRKASEHLRLANALSLACWQTEGTEYDAENQAEFAEGLLRTFTAEFFERTRGFGLDSEVPIFIVGLPRSGTTLIEQILASHSQVYGAGELTLASDTYEAIAEVSGRGPAPLECLRGLTHREAQMLAGRHLDSLTALCCDSGCAKTEVRRIVDKMPGNYFHLGLLAILFPRAKFIHCRRDLRDVALSCWMTNFHMIRWASAPEHIAASFTQYLRIMNHWQGILPVPVLEVQYEETVANLEGTARRLIDWCGLEWEPQCLDFHKTRRAVKTASMTQVRRPIYNNSVGRWKHYEAELHDLFSALPLASE